MFPGKVGNIDQGTINEKIALYRSTENLEIRNEVVLEFSDLVMKIANNLRGIATTVTQIDDMVSVGMLTLIECVENFDENKGMSFISYAYMRVRGSIIDLMRKQDWIPRRVRQNAGEVLKNFKELSNLLLRQPTDREMAEYMGLDYKEYVKINSEIHSAATLSLEEILQGIVNKGTSYSEDIDENSPESETLRKEMKKVLAAAVETLKPQEKKVIALHYYNDLFLNEIAEVLNVTPQRVSKIHTTALMKLQTFIENNYEK
jgi:RNA polymerase sigma factor for flagellar operon FliA